MLISCKQTPEEYSSIDPNNWEKRQSAISASDSLIKGSSYLSVYSHIYSQTEHRQHDLTATVSLRNMNSRDSIYLSKADYYNTHGELIRSYFPKPIFIAPLETVEIVIDEDDAHGGSGANFIFQWHIPENSEEPLFEAVMISTSGQQGISFKTEGKKIQLWSQNSLPKSCF